MRYFVNYTLVLSLLLQTSATPVYAEGNEDDVICNDCIDRDSEAGSVVEVDGETWKLIELTEVDGEPMWSAVPVDAWGDRSGTSFDQDTNGNERLTGRDLTDFEDSDKYSDRLREDLREYREKIINRLNEETRADSEATNNELKPQLDGLNQQVQSAGSVEYREESPAIGPMDPLMALNDSLKSQPGNSDFYPDQAGWQPFDNHEYQSDNKDALNDLRNRLNYSTPSGPQQADAKRAGYYALSQADDAFAKEDDELGDTLFEAAKTLVDIATDIIPITSAPKDFYRAVVGKDPMTGEPLEGWERAIAGGFFIAGIATLGGSNLAKPWGKTISKLAGATEEEIKVLAKSAKNDSSIKTLADRLKDRFGNVKFLDGVKENQKLIREREYTQLAWSENKVVVSAKTTSEQQFGRFFEAGKQEHGSWVADIKDVIGKTPEEIKEMYALEFLPNQVSLATIPADTEMYVGFVGKNAWGGNENVIQYFIPNTSPDFFSKMQPINEIFRGIK